MNLTFKRPSADLVPAFDKFLHAFNPGDQDMWSPNTVFGLARTDPKAYAEFLDHASRGENLPEGWVWSDTYWAFAGDEMAGEVHVRHAVRGRLWRVGGHVGYSVQPKFRGKGVATAMLRHACNRLRELGEPDALLTCWDDNLASASVIEKCGGARMPDALDEGRVARRYLVPLV